MGIHSSLGIALLASAAVFVTSAHAAASSARDRIHEEFPLLAAAMAVVPARAASKLPISSGAIDRTVSRAMQAFDVPGMAVGIVKDGEVVFAKGYGVREYGKPERIDADTLFQIGSNTKAFTAAALAIAVDEGTLRWDDKVIDHLPQFRLYDPFVTREITVRDLLSHRSGLAAGAGDLMFYPQTDFSRAEIIHGLRYLKPVSSFRSKFDYDNVLYLVAGEVVPAVTGQSWEDFVEKKIFAPLQMQACAANYDRIKDRGNVAAPHVMVDGKPSRIEVEDLRTIGPAGTINCSVNAMTKWLQMQLSAGSAPGGTRLLSAERIEDMWTVTTIKPLQPQLAELSRTHFSGYGLGWDLDDTFGRKRVSHTGGVPGSVTLVSMIPELRLGLLVFTNQESGVAMQAVGNQILDAYLGAPARDWVNIASEFSAGRAAQAKETEQDVAKVALSATPPPLALDQYAGSYQDPWRGEASVRREGDGLVLKLSRTRKLEGPLTPHNGNVFIVRWNDRSLQADAYVRFEQGFDGGVQGMTLRAISPATDFSFDFQDLDFRKIEPAAPNGTMQ
jgi:CubicO group peptidase (beta-lactamase class C family)